MADTTTHQGFQKLKDLLLDAEHETLASMRAKVDHLSSRLDTVYDRTATDERLTTSVAFVLDGALREAEEKRHDQLAGAVAPLVVNTIKTELRNSQDEMVEALYPITGRMVKAYVTSALKDLTEQINRRLEQNALMLRLKSLATGRSVADLALADTQRLAVEEVFLIRRGVGELLARYPEGKAGAVPSNSDVQFSGLMTAINDFASEAFADDGGAIRSFKFDDFQVYLRASPLHLVAARCRGVAPPGIETILDEEFLGTLSQSGVDTPAGADRARAALPGLATALERRAGEAQDELTRAGVGFNPLKGLLIISLAGLLGWFAWGWYVDWVTRDVRLRAEAAIASTPGLKGYPTTLTVGPSGRTIAVSGLAPDAATRRDALDRLRAAVPGSIITEQLSVLPQPSNMAEVEVGRVREQLAALEADLTRTAITRLVARADSRVTQTLGEVDNLATLVSDANRRATVTALRREIEAISREVIGYRRAAEAKDGALDLNRMTSGFVRATNRLEAVTGGLAALLGGGDAQRSSPAATPRAAPESATIAAEEMAAAAERVQTIAVAVSQASRIKPVIVTQAAPAPVVVGPTPDQRLADWVRQNAIFFGNGAALRDPVAATADLDQLAELLRLSTARLRIVGYTDERGDNRRNAALATERAETIRRLLTDRGIADDRLIAIGRTKGLDLSTAVGPESPNRRVEFEIAFRYEPGSPRQ